MLTKIFNACFSIGLFPTAFKKFIIKFTPNEGKTLRNPMNYLPISLLETPGKLFWKVIQGRLNVFLNDNSIIKGWQHGFRPKKGTTAAIATAYETIANTLAEKSQAILVLLQDVAKVFDKVWHAGLKYKLLLLGLPPLLEKTFLNNRIAIIPIGNEISNQIQ